MCVAMCPSVWQVQCVCRGVGGIHPMYVQNCTGLRKSVQFCANYTVLRKIKQFCTPILFLRKIVQIIATHLIFSKQYKPLPILEWRCSTEQCYIWPSQSIPVMDGTYWRLCRHSLRLYIGGRPRWSCCQAVCEQGYKLLHFDAKTDGH